MIGRCAEDEGEYSSRAGEIEAWLKIYGAKYLGDYGHGESTANYDDTEYNWHPTDWKYVILDDRPSAAKANTPLFNRFVHTKTEVGLTDDDVDRAIALLQSGPQHGETANNCNSL